MELKTNSPVLFNAEEVYNFFFLEHVCRISLDFPLPLLYFLEGIAQKEDKIILINIKLKKSSIFCCISSYAVVICKQSSTKLTC